MQGQSASFPRTTGILLHPSSLPSRGGIGDFGPAAYEFVDFLAAGRQGLWQILPLGPVGYGNSPYSSISAFAGSPLLISLERLAQHGWIDSACLSQLPDGGDRVEYEQVRARKAPLLIEAAQKFLREAESHHKERFSRFCAANSWWLEDFALFDVLRQRDGKPWYEWPDDLKGREPRALSAVKQEMERELQVSLALQFFFFEQWRALRRYCAERSIRVVGDVAIFVNYDSADVWAHPEIFRLNSALQPEVVSGVPPDAFSETGQRWGNPLYRWDVLKRRNYDWWVQRLRWAIELCDLMRIDHFRGFEQCWEIPAHEPTAVHGRWVDGPKDDLFRCVRENLGELPFIAEDLGLITPEVHALRERLQIPGMKVLQFGFSNPGAHIYLPHRFTPDSVVYTGTHDNDTTVGWWNSGASEEERRYARAYLGAMEDGVHWAFIRAAQCSVAQLCVVPLQDVLGLGSDARMNRPSQSDGNWGWRYRPGALAREVAEKLALLVEVSDRQPVPVTHAHEAGEFAA
jgi:4-alpha-glucanotransferase